MKPYLLPPIRCELPIRPCRPVTCYQFSARRNYAKRANVSSKRAARADMTLSAYFKRTGQLTGGTAGSHVSGRIDINSAIAESGAGAAHFPSAQRASLCATRFPLRSAFSARRSHRSAIVPTHGQTAAQGQEKKAQTPRPAAPLRGRREGE